MAHASLLRRYADVARLKGRELWWLHTPTLSTSMQAFGVVEMTSYMNTSRRECSVERWRWRGLRRRDIVHIVLAVNGGHQKKISCFSLLAVEHEPI